MKKILITILITTLYFGAFAQDNNALWETANKLYIEGKFDQAIETYQKINNSGYESSELYYNMGNSYYKLNKIAKAVLYYEKALQLSPNDEDIRFNLELANRYVVDKIEKLPVFFITNWFISIRNLFSANKWAVLSIIFFFTTLVFITIYLISRKYSLKKFSFWISLLFIVLFLSSLYFSYKQKQVILNDDTAIIMSPSVTIKSSPDISGNDIFVLHEGTKVWVLDQISDWREIKLSDGTKGWLKNSDLEII
ncbi:MAG: tetratricopeptide repeat protein [Bacteroidales bacterium]